MPDAFHPVARDLMATSLVRLRFDVPLFSDPMHDALSLHDDEHGFAIQLQVPKTLSRQEQIVQVADQVQDWTVESLSRQGLPATWPECSEHPGSHPLRPALSGRSPVWECPRTGHTIAVIGSLRPPDTQPRD